VCIDYVHGRWCLSVTRRETGATRDALTWTFFRPQTELEEVAEPNDGGWFGLGDLSGPDDL
jgi:hypothetical protein